MGVFEEYNAFRDEVYHALTTKPSPRGDSPMSTTDAFHFMRRQDGAIFGFANQPILPVGDAERREELARMKELAAVCAIKRFNMIAKAYGIASPLPQVSGIPCSPEEMQAVGDYRRALNQRTFRHALNRMKAEKEQ